MNQATHSVAEEGKAMTEAWLVLGEAVTSGMMIAGALILGGVALSQSRRPRPVIPRQA